MARQSSYMNNAATDFEGWSRWLTKLFRPGVATGWTVSQRGLGANMTVDIAVGDGVPMTTNTAPYSWTTAVENVSIAAASANNRRDLVVAYVDLSVTNPSTATPNNPGALKFLSVAGTPGTSPSDPNDTAIRATPVGATNPYLILARVTLTSSTAQITNAQITNLQTPIALNVQRLYGGSNNALGHSVPNAADDTVALLNATQSFGTGTTVSSRSLSNPYKFRVYRTAAHNSINGFTPLLSDTKEFDTGSNVDVVTNKGRFTAPFSGTYHFNGSVAIASGAGFTSIALYKNGVLHTQGTQHAAGSLTNVEVVTDDFQLVAGDYVEVYLGAGAVVALATGAPYCFFSGHLVSTT